MSLIQPLKFRTWEMGHFKMPRFETPRLQTAVFQMVITVASGHCKSEMSTLKTIRRSRWLSNCPHLLSSARDSYHKTATQNCGYQNS